MESICELLPTLPSACYHPNPPTSQLTNSHHLTTTLKNPNGVTKINCKLLIFSELWKLDVLPYWDFLGVSVNMCYPFTVKCVTF